MKVLSLHGSPYQMGVQHGRQVLDLRPGLVAAMDARLAGWDQRRGADGAVEELRAAWGGMARPTLEMLAGMADALMLAPKQLMRYWVASYLDDLLGNCSTAEACTVWGASNGATRDGVPILAKNRDYDTAHLALQVLADATPQEGHRYLYVTSAGSPAVFSSGINAAGLAIADTHVPSRDIGPGLARYTLMLNLLEQCATLDAALSYLRGVRHMGAGNLILADAGGGLAVCESGYRRVGMVVSASSLVVATNHFVSVELREQYAGPEDAAMESQARYDTAAGALAHLHGALDADRANELMARHRDARGAALCRHNASGKHSTISSVILLPSERRILFRDGPPCRSTLATDLRIPACRP